MKQKLIKLSQTIISILTIIFLAVLAGCQESEGDFNDFVVYDYLLVATGQTSLYDNEGAETVDLIIGDDLYGQDASYLAGANMSYTNNSDGTITDNNTDLMWEEAPLPDGLTYEEAIAYCDSLELGGYDDWRMPSLKELFSISDFGKGWPYLDTTYFKLASGIIDKSEQFWSSNRYVGVTTEGQDNAAFGVNHVTGHIKAYPARSSMGEGEMPEGEGGDNTPPEGENLPPDDGNLPPVDGDFNPLAKHVRAVRGNVYGINDFLDNYDGTITDNGTGLMWTQGDSGEGMDWEDALSFAENSEIAGYLDWRLPNVKELQAIVDYSYSPNAIDASKVGPSIDPIFSCTPIVSEAGYDDYPYFWTSTSANFTSGQPYYYAWYVAFGRAVDGVGEDTHGAGAVRFDTKYEGGPLGEGGERFYNYVRLVRNLD